MKRMKICFVTPYSPKIVGGVGTFILEMCNYLNDKRIETLIITESVENGLDITENILELKIGKIKILSGVLYGIESMLFIFKLRKKIDILHIQTPNYLNCFPLLAGRILRIPVITTFHGKLPYSKSIVKKCFQMLGEKMLYNLSNEVTYVSRDTKKYYKYSKGRIILNGIDTRVFFKDFRKRSKMREKLGLNEYFVILYLGRWVAHKGIYELLDVFSELNKKVKEICLILVGSGEKERILEKIQSMDLNNRVLLFEKVESVREYYCMSDVFVLFTSPQEGLPLAMLEAMACGLPVIATNVSGIPEVINDGKNGLLVRPGDFNDLAEKMTWCINNKGNLKSLGKNAAETIKAQFNIKRVAEEYLEVYKNASRSKP